MENINIIRHSMAHILAIAISKLYPDVKLGIGPSIDEGFYYDFDNLKTGESEFQKIEEEMRKIIASLIKFEKKLVSYKEAKEFMKDEPYKLELIEELNEKGEEISFYFSGDFKDLCAGPHVACSCELKDVAFKIDRTAGAYWRGDEKNKMLNRIYVLCFEKQEELDLYIKQREEAKLRDHKIIGEQLDLFSFNSMAPGACFWHPRGLILWQQLEQLWREMHNRYGYTEIQTPQLAKKDLWVTSGHWDHYFEDMFHFDVEENETLCLKPMDCPFGILIYNTKPHSYRDFPVRYNEIGRIFRNEKSGQLNGLFRVRQITQDDAHIYLREDQILDEISNIIRLQKEFFAIFGLKASYFLSTRPEDFMGEIAVWDKAEAELKEALKVNGIKEYGIKEKDGAFYGPKIDLQVEDALGRTWQLSTIQLDFQLAGRFNMEYTDSDGKKKVPVIIHRAIFGSFERFIGIITEQLAGNYPTWLCPEQVRVLAISEKHVDFANSIKEKILEKGIRVSVDSDNETLGNKIRKATSLKLPYVVIVGDKEIEANKLNIRIRGEKETKDFSVEEFIEKLVVEIKERK